MSKPALRAVMPGDKPARVLTLLEAIEQGDRLQIELAQRRDIVSKLDSATGPAAAALHNQLSRTNDKIEALEARDQQEATKNVTVSDAPFDAAAI